MAYDLFSRKMNKRDRSRQDFVIGGDRSGDNGNGDPLKKLSPKQRTYVAKLIELRTRADAGDDSAKKIISTIADLKIFASAEPAKL